MPTETTPPPSVDPLTTRMSRLEKAIDRVEAGIGGMVDGASPDDLVRLDAIENYVADVPEGVGAGLLEVRGDESRTAFERSVANKALRSMRLGDELNRVRYEHEMTAGAKLGEAWRQFDDTFDYRTALQDVLNNGLEGGHFKPLMTILSDTELIKSADDPAVEVSPHRQAMTLEFLRQHTSETAPEESGRQTPYTTEELTEKIAMLEGTLKRADLLARRYDVQCDEFEFLGISTSRLSLDLFEATVRSFGEESPRLRQAAGELIDAQLQGAPERRVSGDSATDIPIHGLTRIGSDTLRITTETYVQRWLDDNLPPVFLEGMSSIVRVDTGTLRNAEIVGGRVLGNYNPTTGRVYLAFDNETRDYPARPLTPKLLESTQRAGLPTDLSKTLTHEAGHGAHSHVLAFEDLEEWEQVVARDPQYVSWYVKDCDAVDPEDLRKREDFADSMKLFVTSPAHLLALSESRFNYMERLFSKYDQRSEKDIDPTNPHRTWRAKARHAREVPYEPEYAERLRTVFYEDEAA